MSNLAMSQRDAQAACQSANLRFKASTQPTFIVQTEQPHLEERTVLLRCQKDG